MRKKSKQKEHDRSTLPNVSSVESPLRTTEQAHDSEMTQKHSRNVRDIEQVETLFPEFFSSPANADPVQRSEWYNNNHPKTIVLLNEKVKEDPFIQSWLKLYGACFCM